jgi:hypothetical protein
LSVAARGVVNEETTVAEFRTIVFQVFYRVGLVGLVGLLAFLVFPVLSAGETADFKQFKIWLQR